MIYSKNRVINAQNAYIFVRPQATKQSELSHGSMSEGCVLKYSLDLLDRYCLIDVLVTASLNNY
jgi:hypothetical protein